MKRGATLEAVLAVDASTSVQALNADIQRTVLCLAEAGGALSWRIAEPALEGRLGDYAGGVNSDGDAQRKLDLVAESLFSDALRETPVASYVSEETPEASCLQGDGTLALALDPLDGSSGIDVNAPIGALFSILPMSDEARRDPAAAFRQPGRAQVAAGFFVFGPQASLIMSTGQGVHLFTYDRNAKAFRLVEPHIAIPPGYPEFAINASNQRHWPDPVRHYVDDCLRGVDGPRGRNYNMRWMAALVAEAFRIFNRGGVYLYPADSRPGYEEGRLRLVYEANPVAFLCEQAGGAATDGVRPILDIPPRALHERTPLVFGSADKVALIRRYHEELAAPLGGAPLFGRRGLIRR